MKLIVDVPNSLYANLSTIKNESVAGKRILECVKNGTPQEPFMNKPCVAHQVCHEDKVKILDKIRAEINKQYDRVRTYNLSCAEGLEMALGIIDKYNVESEDKEIHSVIDGDFFKGI